MSFVFASSVMLCNHLVTHKQEAISLPKHISENVARRQREIMAIIANVENGEYAEWIDDDYLELNENEQYHQRKYILLCQFIH